MKITHVLLGFAFLFSVNQNYGQIQINSTGNVGMGNYSPSSSYTVRANTSYFYNSYSSINRGYYSYVYESAGIGASYNHEYTLRVNPTTTVQNALYISDPINRTTGTTLYINGDALSTGGWFTSSDRRMKKKERIIDKNNVLSKLTRVRGKKYEYKSKEELIAMHKAGIAHFPIDTIYKIKEVKNEEGIVTHVPTETIEKIVIDVPRFKKGERYGLAAQDVMEEYPELVSMDESTGMYAVDYQGFIPLLLEGFNLQQERIMEMEKELETLRSKVNNGKN